MVIEANLNLNTSLIRTAVQLAVDPNAIPDDIRDYYKLQSDSDMTIVFKWHINWYLCWHWLGAPSYADYLIPRR